ncbi:U-megalopygitoxin(8)-Mo12-like [Choristoneura fumiferana]|uniref:U-megalopygitoxin(8)-Mo12-like n=1 Tax=Choristoneura fumiferana TaxID=7141 RepID=UPI003D15ECF5
MHYDSYNQHNMFSKSTTVKSFIVLVTIPLIIEARLKINITVGSFRNNVKIQTFGSDMKVVTEKEIKIFNITDYNLNRGFTKELGKAPNNLFLKDPTNYDDLFNYFEWEPVRRKLFVKKIKILEPVLEDVVLKRQSNINNSSGIVRSNVSIFQNVETVVRSSWDRRGIPDEDIYYDIIINLHNNHFGYVKKWRDSKIKSRNLPIGIAEEGFIETKPGQSVTVKLSAHKTVVLIEITYAAVLTGSIIGDYQNLYGKYHFYAPAVIDIMRAANLTNEFLTKELLEIRCFTSPKLDMVDGRGRKVYIGRFPVPVPSKK